MLRLVLGKGLCKGRMVSSRTQPERLVGKYPHFGTAAVLLVCQCGTRVSLRSEHLCGLRGMVQENCLIGVPHDIATVL